MMRNKIILLSLLLAGCGIPHLTPYKMEIRQGNDVTPEMRAKLKPGMSKQQVRYLMGTPLLSDDFHANRWDYPYSLSTGGKQVTSQRMTLYFEGDSLARVDDAAMPPLPPAPLADSTADAASAVVPAAPDVPVVEPVAAPTPEEGVKASVQAWALAWSSRDVGAYLAAYAPDYHPAGMSHAAWAKQRQQRIGRAGQIRVGVSDVVVKVADEAHATASFRQDFSSDAYHDAGDKTLVFEKRGGVWLIVAEAGR